MTTTHPRAAWLSGLGIATLGAIFFSAKAIFAKLLYRHGIDAVTLIALRMLLSVPFFAAVAIWTWRREPRIAGRDLLRIGFLGFIGYYLSSMLDFLGLQYISAGLERLILFLTPTFVLLLSLLFLKKAVSGRQWISLGFAYAGIVLVFWHDANLDGRNTLLGASYVLAGAFAYAVYLILSGELIKRVGALRLVALAMMVSAVCSLVQYVVMRDPATLFVQTMPVWSLSFGNATLSTVIPTFLTMIGISRIGAGPAAQAGMIGPVSTIFMGWWILGEPISTVQMAGTALVLAGIFLLSNRKSAPPPVNAAPPSATTPAPQ